MARSVAIILKIARVPLIANFISDYHFFAQESGYRLLNILSSTLVSVKITRLKTLFCNSGSKVI